MDLVQEHIRIDIVVGDQSGERGAVLIEILVTQDRGFRRGQAGLTDHESGHLFLDLRHDIGFMRVKGLVEIEDPGVDMGERRQHRRASRRGGGPAQARAACFGLGRDKPLYDCERSLA